MTEIAFNVARKIPAPAAPELQLTQGERGKPPIEALQRGPPVRFWPLSVTIYHGHRKVIRRAFLWRRFSRSGDVDTGETSDACKREKNRLSLKRTKPVEVRTKKG